MSRLFCVGIRVILTVIGLLSLAPAYSQDMPPQEDIFPLPAAGLNPITGNRKRIPQGSPEEARDYYNDLAKHLKFPGGETPADLDRLLLYFGYKTLQAVDLTELPPADLMADRAVLEVKIRARRAGPGIPQGNEFAAAGWNILAARYFSPKTTDVSAKFNTMSWRKIVRLIPIPGSAADSDGMKALYFLSVQYVNVVSLANNPFSGPPLNVQVIVARDPAAATPKLKDPLAWFVFDPANGFARTDATATSWDAANPELLKKHNVKIPYYVPTSCSHCHGGPGGADATGVLRHPLSVPQFFDTDYIQDRTSDGEDFSALGRSSWATLFDAGRDQAAAQYRDGLAVFWRLNREMIEPTLKLDEGQELPSTAGLKSWMRRHGENELTGVNHIPPIDRGVPVGLRRADDPNETWSGQDPLDARLLPLLNRYCYRCHSGLVYNVFDKQAVRERARSMIGRLNSERPDKRMPQDRLLTMDQIKELTNLLTDLRNKPAKE